MPDNSAIEPTTADIRTAAALILAVRRDDPEGQVALLGEILDSRRVTEQIISLASVANAIATDDVEDQLIGLMHQSTEPDED